MEISLISAEEKSSDQRVDLPLKISHYRTMFAAIILVLIAILFRVLPPLLNVHHSWTSNFSPMASIVLCGCLFFPKKWALWLPLVILAVSDVILNRFAYSAPLFSWEIVPRYVAFLAIGTTAFHFRQYLRDKAGIILASSLAASIFFYVATNTASWVGDTGYTKDASGWIQSLTIGLPSYSPTWMFFRNSLVSDILFTSLFLVSMSAGAKTPAIVTERKLVPVE